MTQSMTAFARVQKQLFCWEIRSVNHRYLDLSFRLPEAFRFLETSLRTLMRDKLSRGKLECQLKLQEVTSTNQSILINENLVDELLAAGNALATSRQLANNLSLTDILNWPGVIQVSQPDVEILAKEAELLFQDALVQLIATRKTEGLALREHIQSRLDKLNIVVNEARLQIASYVALSKEKLMSRLKSLELEVENSRIEQEIAMMLARLDVSEELDRLQMHSIEVAKALSSTEAAGRRLDFLMQELNREANTLGSKSDCVALTQSAVEMKVLIEQMREQIQNIE